MRLLASHRLHEFVPICSHVTAQHLNGLSCHCYCRVSLNFADSLKFCLNLTEITNVLHEGLIRLWAFLEFKHCVTR